MTTLIDKQDIPKYIPGQGFQWRVKMPEQDANAIKGQLLQQWQDARVRKSSAKQSLEIVWQRLEALVGEQAIDWAEEENGTSRLLISEAGTEVVYPKFEDITTFIDAYQEALKVEMDSHRKLSRMGIELEEPTE